VVEADRAHESASIICNIRIAYWITIATNTRFFFHGDNGYANAPLFYIVRTLPALFASVKAHKEERKWWGGGRICERILVVITERNSGGNKHPQMPTLCVLFGVNRVCLFSEVQAKCN
jgi:hypothetical protein